MPPSASHPCLPRGLVEILKAEPAFAFKESYIFSPEFEHFRLQALSPSPDDPSFSLEVETMDLPSMGESIASAIRAPDPALPFPQNVTQNWRNFRLGDGKTWLHWAIRDADVPLVYELVRMGIDIDRKDKDGVTPLFFTLFALYSERIVYAGLTDPTSFPSDCRTVLHPELERDARLNSALNRNKRLARIIELLVEQDANLDVSAFGCTPLALAAEFELWDVVELLIIYGATPIRPESLRIASQADKARLASIQNKISVADPRPARPCPCWSGKPLSECHGATKLSYPDHFICRCGARKVYAACCGKRGVELQEYWDTEKRRIVTSQKEKVYIPDVNPELQDQYEAGRRLAQELCGQSGVAVEAMDQGAEFFAQQLRAVGREDDVDPAYMYAMSRAKFYPR